MSDIITTLHPENDEDTNLYPNIKRDNIPDAAINTIKIENGAVTEEKLANNSVGTDKIQDGSITSEKLSGMSIQPLINEWLDEHPEATTTVEDGSLTETKFSNQLKEQAINNLITPEMFGAVGDGITDDTLALQNMINYSNSVKKGITLLNKTYLITSSLILPSYVNIDGNDALIRSNGDFEILKTTGSTKISNGVIKNIRLYGSENDTYTNNIGIKFAGIYCVFENITISYCYDGIVEYVEGTSGNQVSNKFLNLYCRYIYNDGLHLGDTGNNQITDGWVENVNIGASNYGIYIGAAKGFFIKDVHIWSNPNTAIFIYDTTYTVVNGVYIESFRVRGLHIHLKGDVKISNISSHLVENDTYGFYFNRSASAVNGRYSILMDNISLTNATDKTGYLFGSENRDFEDVKISNYSIGSGITFSNTTRIIDPTPVLKGYIDFTPLADGNTINIKCNIPNMTLSKYYKCKIDIISKRYYYGTANVVASYEIFICQGGSSANSSLSVNEIITPTGFATNPSFSWDYITKQLTCTLTETNLYPTGLFYEFFD